MQWSCALQVQPCCTLCIAPHCLATVMRSASTTLLYFVHSSTLPRHGLHCPALPCHGIALLCTAFHFPEYNLVVLFLVFCHTVHHLPPQRGYCTAPSILYIRRCCSTLASPDSSWLNTSPDCFSPSLPFERDFHSFAAGAIREITSCITTTLPTCTPSPTSPWPPLTFRFCAIALIVFQHGFLYLILYLLLVCIGFSLWISVVGDPRPKTHGSPWVYPNPEHSGPGK